jgi:AcrR family transcriptional regulator
MLARHAGGDVISGREAEARTSGRPRSARINDAVLRTTLRHLAERGYAGTSINAIAAELGISKPTIYLRWPSKIDLATAAVTSLYVDQPEDLTDDVRANLLAHVRRVHQVHKTVGIGLLGSLLAEQHTNPPLIAALRERAVRPSRQRARRILQAGIRQGVIRADADINAAVDMLVGALYAGYVAGDDQTFDAESVVDTLLAGLTSVGCGDADPANIVTGR